MPRLWLRGQAYVQGLSSIATETRGEEKQLNRKGGEKRDKVQLTWGAWNCPSSPCTEGGTTDMILGRLVRNSWKVEPESNNEDLELL